MHSHRAPGLPADWLNAWLAAIGVTVIVPGARLSWSDDARPVASFELVDDDPARCIAEHLPTVADVDRLVIAKKLEGTTTVFAREVTLDAFRERAEFARLRKDFSLACSVTDLIAGKRFDPKKLEHSPFDPPAPKGETLHDRLRRCAMEVASDPVGRVRATLAGTAERVEANGLGFDFRRIPGGAHPDAKKHIDPVVEVLAFYGLSLFPFRGDGRAGRAAGWIGRPNRPGSFIWPAWATPLDRWAIDALLDKVRAESPDSVTPATRRRLRLYAGFAVVPYLPTGSSDPTRAYGSRRLW